MADNVDNLRLVNFPNNQLAELIENLKNSIASVIISEYDGNIVYVNKVFEQRSGYSRDEVMGQNPRFLKSDETNPDKHKKLWETITSGKIWRGEFRNKNKNGNLYWEYTTIHPIKDYTKKLKYFLAIKEDISQIKIFEDSLKKVVNSENNLLELKFEFLNQFSNEIAAPLNSSLDFIRLLRNKCETSYHIKCNSNKNYYDIINHQAEKVLVTIKTLLEISEIKNEDAKTELNFYNRAFLKNLVNEIIEPVSIILGILLLLKNGFVLSNDVDLVTGLNIIQDSCNRINVLVDIFFECSANENNDIHFYENVLSRISEEKERLENPLFELASRTSKIEDRFGSRKTNSQFLGLEWIAERKVEDEAKKDNTFSEIKLKTDSPSFLFKRNQDMLIETKSIDDITVVFVNSYRASFTDAKTIKEFIYNIIEAGARNLIVDLSLCNNIDSTFTGVLIIIKRKLKEYGGKIALVFNSNHVYSESFALLNIELQFEIYPTLEKAIKEYEHFQNP